MSRVCELSGSRVRKGNNVSKANNKTRTRWLPNLKNKKYFVPELGQTLTLTLTARSIRTIDKQGGITLAVLKAKTENLSERLLKVRRALTKVRKPAEKTAATSASV